VSDADGEKSGNSDGCMSEVQRVELTRVVQRRRERKVCGECCTTRALPPLRAES